MPLSQSTDLKPALARLAEGGTLNRAEAARAFDIIMSGAATPAQIGAFLMGLRQRGETTDEIVGAVETMRAKALSIAAPPGAIDTCGTGGDGVGTYNISTAVAFVVAACGVPVAKHGNRRASSLSGAADVLDRLGVDIDADHATVERCLVEAGTAFLMAPRYHSAMRHVAPVRSELGLRTLFNVLGPLANPAGTRRQLMGVYAVEWMERLAQVQRTLGAEAVWIVRGRDGLDELTLTTDSDVVALAGGQIRRFVVTPEDAGLERAPLDALKGGTPEHNAEALRAVLDGVPGAYRRIVLLNAAAALIVADRAATLAEGAAMAAEAIDQGRARAVLDRLVAITHGARAASPS